MLTESVMRYYRAARCPGLGRGIERSRMATREANGPLGK